MEEWVRIVFIDVLIPIATFFAGFLTKSYYEKRKNTLKIKSKILASGDNSIAAGGDVNVKN